MFETEVNLVAVLVAAIANMAIGFLWYSPALFGAHWMKLMGFTKKSMEKAKGKMGPMYAIAFVGTLVMGYVLAVLVNTMQVLTLAEGLQLGGLLWLGFVATVQMTEVIFGGKKWMLFVINTGYQLATILAMSTILVLWI